MLAYIARKTECSRSDSYPEQTKLKIQMQSRIELTLNNVSQKDKNNVSQP